MTEIIAKYRVTGIDHSETDGYCSGNECDEIDYVRIKFINCDKLKSVEVFNDCSCSRENYGSGSCWNNASAEQTWTLIGSMSFTDDIKNKIIEFIEQYNNIVHDKYTMDIEDKSVFNMFHDTVHIFDHQYGRKKYYEKICSRENREKILRVESNYKNFLENIFN